MSIKLYKYLGTKADRYIVSTLFKIIGSKMLNIARPLAMQKLQMNLLLL